MSLYDDVERVRNNYTEKIQDPAQNQTQALQNTSQTYIYIYIYMYWLNFAICSYCTDLKCGRFLGGAEINCLLQFCGRASARGWGKANSSTGS